MSSAQEHNALIERHRTLSAVTLEIAIEVQLLASRSARSEAEYECDLGTLALLQAQRETR